MPTAHRIAIIAVMAAVTIFIRFFPFVVFGRGKQTPPFLMYLGQVLPAAAMALLVVYALKGVSVTTSPYGIPELIAVLLTAALQYWKGNTLVSVICGTVCYMILVQMVF